jgi:hypothetical protein
MRRFQDCAGRAITPEIDRWSEESENGRIIGLPVRAAVRGPTTILAEGSVAMAVDPKILDVLKLSELKSKLPRDPEVVDIRVEEYVDTDGEDALSVWVILDESVDVEKSRVEDIIALKSAIRDRIREQGTSLWPYMHVAKQSEFDEEDED